MNSTTADRQASAKAAALSIAKEVSAGMADQFATMVAAARSEGASEAQLAAQFEAAIIEVRERCLSLFNRDIAEAVARSFRETFEVQINDKCSRLAPGGNA